MKKKNNIVVKWANFYGDGYCVGNVHDTREAVEAASEDSKYNVVAILKFTWNKTTNKLKIEQNPKK